MSINTCNNHQNKIIEGVSRPLNNYSTRFPGLRTTDKNRPQFGYALQLQSLKKYYSINIRPGSSQKSDLCLKDVVKNLWRGLEHPI